MAASGFQHLTLDERRSLFPDAGGAAGRDGDGVPPRPAPFEHPPREPGRNRHPDWTYAASRTVASTVRLQGRAVLNAPRNAVAMPIAAAPR